MEKIPVERTKKGYPALWECGGGYTNTGKATIIASAEGKKKKPVYIRRRGHLACAEHALFVIEKGDYVIEANHHREDFEISIYKIINFFTEQYEKPCHRPIGTITKKEFKEKFGIKYEEAYKKEKYSLRDMDECCSGFYKITDDIAFTYSFPESELVDLYTIEKITKTIDYAGLEIVAKYSRGEWDVEPPACLKAAIKAAKEKATCYHCREPHFAIE